MGINHKGRTQHNRKDRATHNINWDEIELAYVNGNMDLIFFSREYTKNPEDPTMNTLQQKYFERKWNQLREARIKQELIESQGKIQAFQDEIVQVQLTAREDLINANRVIETQLRLSDQLRVSIDDLTKKFYDALPHLDLQEMASNDPRGFMMSLKILTELHSAVTDVERKVLNVAGLSVQLNQPQEAPGSSQSDKIAAIKDMSTDELLKSYMSDLDG